MCKTTILIEPILTNEGSNKLSEKYSVEDGKKRAGYFIALGLNPATSDSSSLDKSNMKILNLLTDDDNFNKYEGYRLYYLITEVTKSSDLISDESAEDLNINTIANELKNLDINVLLFYGRGKGKKVITGTILVELLKKIIIQGNLYISVSSENFEKDKEKNRFLHISLASKVRKVENKDLKDLWN